MILRKLQKLRQARVVCFPLIPWNMSWNPICEFRLSAKFCAEVLVQISLLPEQCSALLGPSPTISRQESKSCRTEDRVSGSSPQPSTFQEKNIHTIRQCMTELNRSVTFQDTSFRDCPLVQRGWRLFAHLGSISQSQPNCYADFCLNCKKVRTTKLKMATVWPPFTTASRGTELNLVSLQMHVGGPTSKAAPT